MSDIARLSRLLTGILVVVGSASLIQNGGRDVCLGLIGLGVAMILFESVRK